MASPGVHRARMPPQAMLGNSCNVALLNDSSSVALYIPFSAIVAQRLRAILCSCCLDSRLTAWVVCRRPIQGTPAKAALPPTLQVGCNRFRISPLHRLGSWCSRQRLAHILTHSGRHSRIPLVQDVASIFQVLSALSIRHSRDELDQLPLMFGWQIQIMPQRRQM